jgi:hypothetical protein
MNGSLQLNSFLSGRSSVCDYEQRTSINNTGIRYMTISWVHTFFFRIKRTLGLCYHVVVIMCLHILLSCIAEGMALKSEIREGGLHGKLLRESNINFNLC